MLKVTVECDGCGEQGAAGPWKVTKGHQMRKDLKAKGWRHKDGKDMCPQCIALYQSYCAQKNIGKGSVP